MKWKSKLKFAAIFVFAAAIALASSANAATKYVKQGATGSGASWDDPSGTLAADLDDASAGDIFYVAAGDYSPDYTFDLKKGVKLYGGYDPDSSGTETTTNRDIAKYVTILNGNNVERGAAVVTSNTGAATTDTRIDGFTITGGNNPGRSWIRGEGIGGGMWNNHSSPTVANCIFLGNMATWGGGMCNSDSSPTVTNCTFSENSAGNFGGGMYVYSSTSATIPYPAISYPAIMNCTFSGNTAEKTGGGICNSDSSSTVTNCTFAGNTADSDGGGMHVNRTMPLSADLFSPVVVNTIFWGNTASKYGNEIYNTDGTLTLSNNVIAPGGVDNDAGTITSSDMVWADPKLGAFTGVYYPLLEGSSAIDKGLAVGTPVGTTFVPATDQLGKARPAAPALVTIGSFEYRTATVTGVTLNKTTTTIVAGSTEKLTATVNPVASADQSVTWSSNAPTIATVGATTGVVTAVAAGTATITATTADGNFKANCTVTVTQPVTSVTLNKAATSIDLGKSETLTVATVMPADATNKNVTWSTSSSDIATVTVSGGTVTAHKIGTAVITATAVDGSGKSASCTVTAFKTPPISPDPNPPTKPVGTPDDVEAKPLTIKQNITADQATAEIGAAAGAMPTIAPADLEVVDGVVVVKEALALELAKQIDPTNKSVVALPVFSTDVGSGKTAMVAFGVSGAQLMASAPDKVKVMKVLSADKGEFFKYESAPGNFADKAFTIMNLSDDVFTSPIVANGSYKLVLFIKDGGSFDLDGAANSKIVDPAAIVGTSSTPPGSTPSSPTNAGSGCNAAVPGMAFAFVLALPLMMVRKKK